MNELPMSGQRHQTAPRAYWCLRGYICHWRRRSPLEVDEIFPLQDRRSPVPKRHPRMHLLQRATTIRKLF